MFRVMGGSHAHVRLKFDSVKEILKKYNIKAKYPKPPLADIKKEFFFFTVTFLYYSIDL